MGKRIRELIPGESKEDRKRRLGRERYAENREHYLEIYAQRYAADREKELERSRRYYAANPERKQEQRAKRYAANPEKARESQREYRRTRRVRKLQAEGMHTIENWKLLCKFFDNQCLSCGATDVPLTEDHVIALSIGGSDYISNIQPLCKTCNSAKFIDQTDYRDNYWG